MKKQQKYWYFTTIHFCVICGKERKYRSRVTKKPENSPQWIEDGCSTHFI